MPFKVLSGPGLSIAATVLGICGGAFGQAIQVKYTNAFPGLQKFNQPVYFGAFPGKPKTNVVLEQHTGLALLVYQKGTAWVTDTLVKIDVNLAGEMGLLGIAFHPDYNANHKYYVSYDPPGGTLYNMVDERIADATGMKDSGAKPRNLIKIADKYDNHNGGTIAFGTKDGLLYLGTGDGGSGGDPDGNAQNTNVLLGKFLRIDVNGKDAGLEYAIPAGNPFAKGGGRGEIFALGVRNPWKWSFDPLNGDLWLGDVGQDNIEETDIVTVGGNYGWKVMEGPSGSNTGKMILPIHSYTHSVGTCIIGGVVFRGDPASKLYGTYFTTDINTRKLWALKKNGTGLAGVEEVTSPPTGISSFGTDAEGRVYVVGINTGLIYTMDSPDLTPAVSVLGRGAFRSGSHGRSFTAAPGARLDAGLFAKSDVLEAFSTSGIRVGLLSKSRPRLPDGFRAGIYLLRPAGGSALPDLLMVR
ncbi:MAG: glucose sorbosone dehydrogenase [Fibrobacteres bacterium]|nr:glucose sorbosone dehydrogenase [Fibrobacterota bacterium]